MPVMNYKLNVQAGAIFGLLSVLLGAFGAHGLEAHLNAQMLQRYHTGVAYQFYHAFALMVTGLLQLQFNSKYLKYAGIAFIAGILLFSGSLYAYALSGIRLLGMITPLGGLAFIIGWLFILSGTRQIATPKLND